MGVQQIFAECMQRMRVCTVQLSGLLQASSHHSIIPNHVSLSAQVPVLTSPKLLSPMLVALHWILSPSPSLMFHLASFSLGVTSGLWLCLTPGWDHIVAASWPWPSCPPSLPLPCQPPLHLPKHSVTLPTNVLPLGCLSYCYTSFKGRFKCLILPQGGLIHRPEVSVMPQRPNTYLSLF